MGVIFSIPTRCNCQPSCGCDCDFFCCGCCQGGLTCCWTVTPSGLTGDCAGFNATWTLHKDLVSGDCYYTVTVGRYNVILTPGGVLGPCGYTLTFQTISAPFETATYDVGSFSINDPLMLHPPQDYFFCCLANVFGLTNTTGACATGFPDTITITPVSNCADCDEAGTVFDGCGNCGDPGGPMAKAWTFTLNGVTNGTGPRMCSCCTDPTVGPGCGWNGTSWTIYWTRGGVTATSACVFAVGWNIPYKGMHECAGSINNAHPILYYDKTHGYWVLTIPGNWVYHCSNFVCNGVNTFTLFDNGMFCDYPATLTLTPA